MDDFVWTTVSMRRYIPLFYEKVGRSKPMRIEVNFKDLEVQFGRYNTNVTLDYTACIYFKTDGPNGSTSLLYDEIKMLSSAQVSVKDDIMQMSIDTHKINFDKRYGTRLKPLIDNMSPKLSEYEYRKFLSTFGFAMN